MERCNTKKKLFLFLKINQLIFFESKLTGDEANVGLDNRTQIHNHHTPCGLDG
jgi:hypothetical protein